MSHKVMSRLKNSLALVAAISLVASVNTAGAVTPPKGSLTVTSTAKSLDLAWKFPVYGSSIKSQKVSVVAMPATKVFVATL